MDHWWKQLNDEQIGKARRWLGKHPAAGGLWKSADAKPAAAEKETSKGRLMPLRVTLAICHLLKRRAGAPVWDG